MFLKTDFGDWRVSEIKTKFDIEYLKVGISEGSKEQTSNHKLLGFSNNNYHILLSQSDQPNKNKNFA